MIRHFNYTKRQALPAGAVSIQLHPGADAPTFDAQLDFSGLALPPDARVFIEAHYKSSYQRFDWGKVSSPQAPAIRLLDEVDRGSTVLFRVKVVDASGTLGRIVAERDDSGGEPDGVGAAARESILPVNFKDLGQEMWRLVLDDGGPILEVNNFPGAQAIARGDPMFIGLVIPEAVRQVLYRIVLEDAWDGASEATGWQAKWLRFASSVSGESPPGPGTDEEAREEWVNRIVRSFCEKRLLKNRILDARGGEQES